MPQARELGTLKVVLEQIPVGAGRLEISAQFFQNNVESYINDLFKKKLFVTLYLPLEAEKLKLVPNHIIRIQFDDFVVGKERIHERIMKLTSKDSVKVGTHTEKDGSTVIVYNKVTANYREFTKEIISEGLVDIKIIEFNSNKVLLQNKLPGKYTWVSNWSIYNGDERALTKEQLNLCKQREIRPPASQDLFVEFTKPIYDQISVKIKTFYSRY